MTIHILQRIAAGAVCAAACSACELTEPLEPRDQAVIDATLNAWLDSGLDDPGGCAARVEVRRHDSLDRYARACAGPLADVYVDQARQSAGCMTTEMRGPRRVNVGILRLAPGYHGDPGLVAHEYLHWLSRCVSDGDSDPGHADPLVWEAAGGGDSVQARVGLK